MENTHSLDEALKRIKDSEAITLPDTDEGEVTPLDLSKYMGRGEKMFHSVDEIDNYIEELRANDRTYYHVNDTAVLSSFDKYTTFSFNGKTLTFRTCDDPERYTKVLTWDDGYLEVMAKYRQRDHEIEEYINLEPILNHLNMDRDAFLKPIKKVMIQYI